MSDDGHGCSVNASIPEIVAAGAFGADLSDCILASCCGVTCDGVKTCSAGGEFELGSIAEVDNVGGVVGTSVVEGLVPQPERTKYRHDIPK